MNFGPQVQEDSMTQQSLVNLGQKVANAIETHSASQAAQAMLPAIQQQYATGMQKIASGDSGGITDVTQAAGLASRNPLTSQMGTQMMNGAIQANENWRNSQLFNARMAQINAKYPVDESGNPIPKAATEYQQSEMQKASSAAQNTQIDQYNAMYEGDSSRGIKGIGDYAKNIDDSIKDGKDPSVDDIRGLVHGYSLYKQKQAAYGKNSVSNSDIDNAYNELISKFQTKQKELADQIQEAKSSKNDVTNAPVPGSGFTFGGMLSSPILQKHQNLVERKQNIDNALEGLMKLQNIGSRQIGSGNIPASQYGQTQAPAQVAGTGLPSMQSNQDQDQQIQQGNATFKTPEEVRSAYQSGQITKAQAKQLISAFSAQ